MPGLVYNQILRLNPRKFFLGFAITGWVAYKNHRAEPQSISTFAGVVFSRGIMDLNRFLDSQFDEHSAVVAETRAAVRAPFAELVARCLETVRKGGKIVFFGNGGSASDSQHLATELSVRYIRDRAPIAAIALTTDTSALTAIGNDLGFDKLFSRQVEALCKPEDTIIGFSTSGNSANVLEGLKAARAIGCTAAGFGGRDGGLLKTLADPCLIVPSNVTSRIQEMHIILGHSLCGALEIELGLI